MITIGWIFCGAGFLFCLTGLYIMYRRLFETDKKIFPAILIMIMGIILISIGTAKYLYPSG